MLSARTPSTGSVAQQHKDSLVAIDFDNVIMETAPLIVRHYNQRFDTRITLESWDFHNVRAWKAPDEATIIARIEAYLEVEDHRLHPPPQATVNAIGDLAKRHELYVVSGRAKALEAVTRGVLDRYFPGKFRSVVFTNKYHSNGQTKVGAALQLGAEVLIDDDLNYARDAAGRGITALLFGEYPWSRASELPPKVKRVRDWAEVVRII